MSESGTVILVYFLFTNCAWAREAWFYVLESVMYTNSPYIRANQTMYFIKAALVQKAKLGSGIMLRYRYMNYNPAPQGLGTVTKSSVGKCPSCT